MLTFQSHFLTTLNLIHILSSLILEKSLFFSGFFEQVEKVLVTDDGTFNHKAIVRNTIIIQTALIT